MNILKILKFLEFTFYSNTPQIVPVVDILGEYFFIFEKSFSLIKNFLSLEFDLNCLNPSYIIITNAVCEILKS